MRTLKGLLTVAFVAILTGGIVGGGFRFVRASAHQAITVSGDVTKLPPRANMTYEALPSSAGLIVPEEAVSAAEHGLSLSDGQLDQSTPVVRAIVSMTNSPLHQREKAWVVTFDDDIIGPGNGVLYHKLCVVIDAITGSGLYAFVADPDQAHSPGAGGSNP